VDVVALNMITQGIRERTAIGRIAFQQMTQEVMGGYSQLFAIPLTYAQEGLRSAQFPI